MSMTAVARVHPNASGERQAGYTIIEVLVSLARIVKRRCRQEHIRGVMARHVALADWPLRCAMAEILRQRLAGWLPHQLQRCSSRQLAGELEQLLALDIAARQGIAGPVSDIAGYL